MLSVKILLPQLGNILPVTPFDFKIVGQCGRNGFRGKNVRWFETDDFSIHYSEQYQTGTAWDCRWDCHPNDHTTREHFHPPPDASTPGEDTTYSTDWRDVLTTVLTRLDDRIEAFWNQ